MKCLRKYEPKDSCILIVVIHVLSDKRPPTTESRHSITKNKLNHTDFASVGYFLSEIKTVETGSLVCRLIFTRLEKNNQIFRLIMSKYFTTSIC